MLKIKADLIFRIYLFWQFFHITENAPPPPKSLSEKKTILIDQGKEIFGLKICVFCFQIRCLSWLGTAGLICWRASVSTYSERPSTKRRISVFPGYLSRENLSNPGQTDSQFMRFIKSRCHHLHVVQDRHSSNLTKSIWMKVMKSNWDRIKFIKCNEKNIKSKSDRLKVMVIPYK